ncbi:ActD-like protein [Corallococcus interemptor]|uniref:ActD-like protein n=1 Tax=Corallococcus TaxID=83461 RepID=UPI001CBBF55D|nr:MULTISPECIES: ActD-like protein [unclassified Corallococcus]MBZ4333986.1 ActD-like protein [Corallococcus sp. AS-1-12]MBZ4376010.1 ActD-like protein [Corallococcus sp. AS-1-6]
MTSPHRTPDWLLERIALGELPPDELAAARDRLSREPDGPARLAALEADSRATLEALPPDRVAREVQARFARAGSPAATPRAEAPPSRPSWRFLPALVPVLAAATLVVLVRPGASSQQQEARDPWAATGTPGVLEPTRSKGLQPRLDVHRQAGTRTEHLTDGAPAQAGDVVQLSYTAAGHAHGVILSVDGRGTVTPHLPALGDTSAPLERGGSHLLPRAYELDDAPGFERFFLVTSDAAFDLEGVMAAARVLAASPEARTAPLTLPAGLGQTSFLLEKPSP